LSYCRKRSKNPPRPRKRSCLSCTKSKCYCDSALPACSKCVKRGITCLYQHSTGDVSRLREKGAVFVPSENFCADLEDAEGEALSLGHTYEDLSGEVEDLFHFETLFSVGVQDTADGEYISAALLQPNQHIYNESSLASNRQQADFLDPRIFSLTIQPTLRAPRAFTPRTVTYRRLSLNRKYVICTLKSYPQRLLQNKDPPPFTHTQYLPSNSQHEARLQTSLIDPLATCSGIVAMWCVKNKNNSAFIWHSIRTEQERLFEQVGSLNPMQKTMN
jgi:hypothetical protein